ncbi:type II pantothenate kinase [Falsibacillus pallidus]|uniref:Pantothenate kinase n=1 Tax=Falsibacillus pallidus TaxID=493781 RepID=A0A370GNT9_9BACI|nr:type II pantothenate kinase [Falsibacillus pallidus]RDI45395.1 pantothenate kinase [Falsibacillus pallidus]
MDKKQIGIDAGGSLIKIAYFENGMLHTKMYSNEQTDEFMGWISFLSLNHKVVLTGGKAVKLRNHFQGSKVIPEFEATAIGTDYLLKKEKNVMGAYILTMIGTGTSIQYIHQGKGERLLGSGIGGGSILGLGRLLTGSTNFHELMELAEKGQAGKLDLQVRDIFESDDTPIPGDLTAANFGKVYGMDTFSKEDQMAAVTNMAAETIVLLSTQAALSKGVRDIVFVGGAIEGNTYFRKRLATFRKMMDYTPHFLDRGPFVGAIGAMLSGN